jgi:hypothetical protein
MKPPLTPTRRRVVGLVIAASLVGATGAGCTDSFGRMGTTSRLVVAFEPNQDVGSKSAPLPLTFDRSQPIAVDITAYRIDGSVDTSYNGYVRISVKPGSVVNVTGRDVGGRNVLMRDGVATGVGVSVAGSFGETHIWAEDVGYAPADPSRAPPPQCADGIDNDGDALVDYPTDPGCAFANDDTEDPGTFAAGATPTLWFTVPRVADVRGVAGGGTATSFPHQQVSIDTGYHPTVEDPTHHDWSLVVTRVSTDGFYVTDICDSDAIDPDTRAARCPPATPRGYASVFAYNFSTPPLMRLCDRLRQLSGTASDFYGFTEMGFPTWELEEWDPRARPCLIPEPHAFTIRELQRSDTGTYLSTAALVAQIAALVRVESDPANGVDVHVSKHFGPGYPAKDADYAPGEQATNCDLNKDGKVDFSADPERACAAACESDVECTEYSNFLSQGSFNLVMLTKEANTGSYVAGSIEANGRSSAQFDPIALRGKPVRAFTGTLRYFSGGTQYTIEARCADDIVVDQSAAPLPSDRACVRPRTISDNNSASN